MAKRGRKPKEAVAELPEVQAEEKISEADVFGVEEEPEEELQEEVEEEIDVTQETDIIKPAKVKKETKKLTPLQQKRLEAKEKAKQYFTPKQ